MKRATVVLGLAALLCGAKGAQAGTITYTVSAVASGTLGSTSFTSASVTIEFVGDPTKPQNEGVGHDLWINHGLNGETGTVTIMMPGGPPVTATFDAGTVAYDEQKGGSAGISFGVGGSTILATIETDFLTYELKTPIGPVSGTALINPNSIVGTSLGPLTFSSVGATSTFTATTGTTTIPEPGSLIFVSTGLLSLIGLARRRLS